MFFVLFLIFCELYSGTWVHFWEKVREFILRKPCSVLEIHLSYLLYTLNVHTTFRRYPELLLNDIQNFFFYVRSIYTTPCFQKEINLKFCFVSDFALLLNFCFWKFYKLILYFYLILSCFTLTSSRKTIP